MYDQQPLRFHPLGPKWRDFNTRFGENLPHSHREWLLDKGSLTKRLIKTSNHQFCVNVLRQQWGKARTCEYQLLNIQPAERCLIREVLLLCHQQPWVYARSVLPVSSLTGKLRHLRHFDNRPLGQLLFNTPNLKRSTFQIAQLTAQQLPAQTQQYLPDKSATVWGRRSRFVLYNKPLLVSEVFLPNFCP